MRLALGTLCIVLCPMLLLLWLIGILATDRYLLTQYLYWFNPLFVLAAITLLLIGRVLRRGLSQRRMGKPVPIAVGTALAFMLASQFGLFRWARSLTAPTPPASTAGSIRVSHWNMSGFEVPKRIDIGRRLAQEGAPDIVFISIQNNPRLWQQIETAMKAERETEQITLLRFVTQKVFTRFPVVSTYDTRIPLHGPDAPTVAAVPRWIRSALGMVFRSLNLHNRSPIELEPATLIQVRLDTTATLGRITTAWYVDMPSSPMVGRASLTRHLRFRIDALLQRGTLNPPDFIIGDFNIARGSASLETFAPGFTEASATAGLGRNATWPRPIPLLAIDHTLVSPQWRSADYTIIDPGSSEHMAQTLVLWPAKPPPATAPATTPPPPTLTP